MDALRFRPVAPSDANWLHGLFVNERLALRTRRTPTYERTEVVAWLAKTEENVHRFVAERSGLPVACAVTQQTSRPRIRHNAMISMLLVDPAADDREQIEAAVLDHQIHFSKHWLGARRDSCWVTEGDESLPRLLTARGYSHVGTDVDAVFINGSYRGRMLFERVDADLLASPKPATIGPIVAPSSTRPRGNDAAIVLRPPLLEDAADSQEMMTQDEACAGTLQVPSRELSTFTDRLTSAKSTSHRLAAVIDGKMVGRADLMLSELPCEMHNAALWVAVHRDYWGRGVGRKLMQELLRIGFDWLGLHRVELSVWSHNPAARKLYDSLGFQHEGTQHRQALGAGGCYADSDLMAILRPQWQARQEL